MKVAAFNGSPAGVNSATNKMAEHFLKGCQNAGAEVRNIQLADYNIEQCKGCFACWFHTPGKCVIQDDMKELLEAYLDADVVLFGSPVFSWNMTGLLKNFVDRLVPLKSPLLRQTNGDFDMQDTEKREQRYVVLSNCGFPGEHNFEIIRAAFSICNPSLEIYRNCGKLLKSKQEQVQPIVEKYLHALEQAGYEFVSAGNVSEKTMVEVNAPLMSTQEYVQFLGM